jgi:hypothetical protein
MSTEEEALGTGFMMLPSVKNAWPIFVVLDWQWHGAYSTGSAGWRVPQVDGYCSMQTHLQDTGFSGTPWCWSTTPGISWQTVQMGPTQSKMRVVLLATCSRWCWELVPTVWHLCSMPRSANPGPHTSAWWQGTVHDDLQRQHEDQLRPATWLNRVPERRPGLTVTPVLDQRKVT